MQFKEPKVFIALRILMAAFVIFAAITHGPMWGVVAFICSLLYFGMGCLGRLTRQALPETFRLKRTLIMLGLASAPAALFTISSLIDSILHPRPEGSIVYSNFDNGSAMALCWFLALCLALPAYAVTRSARTAEVKPLITLALLIQSPLFVGFLMQIILHSTGANPAPLIVSGLIALLASVATVAASAAFGAKINGVKHRRKMRKFGGSLLGN